MHQLVSEPYDSKLGAYGDQSSSGHGFRRGSPKEQRCPAEEPYLWNREEGYRSHQYGWRSPEYGWGSPQYGYGYTPAMEPPPSPSLPPTPESYGMFFTSPSPYYASPYVNLYQQQCQFPSLIGYPPLEMVSTFPTSYQQYPMSPQPYTTSPLPQQHQQYPLPTPDPYGYPLSLSPWNHQQLQISMPHQQSQFAPNVFDGMPVRGIMTQMEFVHLPAVLQEEETSVLDVGNGPSENKMDVEGSTLLLVSGLNLDGEPSGGDSEERNSEEVSENSLEIQASPTCSEQSNLEEANGSNYLISPLLQSAQRKTEVTITFVVSEDDIDELNDHLEVSVSDAKSLNSEAADVEEVLSRHKRIRGVPDNKPAVDFKFKKMSVVSPHHNSRSAMGNTADMLTIGSDGESVRLDFREQPVV